MATLKELETALFNADQAGDVEAAKMLAQAVKAQRAMPQDTPAATKKPARLPEKMDSLDLTWAERNIAPALEKVFGSNPQGSPVGRVIQGAADAPIGAMQLAANVLPDSTGIPQKVNERVSRLEEGYQQQRKEAGSEGFDAWRIGGNVVGTAPMVSAKVPAAMWAKLLRGGATGAAFGAAQPVANEDFWGEKGKQTAVGTIGGAVGVPISSAIARLVRPATDPAARKLIDEGMTLTPGQALGGSFRRTEDAMTSVPVVGDFIRNAKNRTLEDFNRAAYGRALRSIGKSADDLPAGPEGVLAVKRALGEAYDDLLPKMTWKADGPFVQGINNLRGLASSLPEREAKQFEAILTKNLQQMSQGGTMDGQTFKLVEGNLGKEAKGFIGATDGYQKKLGEALLEAQSLFKEALSRSNPKYADELAKINEGYANYVRIRGAAASAGDKSSGFTPAQLAAAVRAQDKSTGKGATATSQALMQDLTDAGRSILPSTVSDSGSPLRHAIQLAIPGGIAGAAIPGAAPIAGTAAGAGALMTLPYTKYGQKLAQLLLAKRPRGADAAADLLRQGGPLLGAASMPALLE